MTRKIIEYLKNELPRNNAVKSAMSIKVIIPLLVEKHFDEILEAWECGYSLAQIQRAAKQTWAENNEYNFKSIPSYLFNRAFKRLMNKIEEVKSNVKGNL